METAWAAGLFEGEGCILLSNDGYPQLSVRSSDRDVLDRFSVISTKHDINGNITSQWDGDPRHKRMYSWRASGWNNVSLAYTVFKPWLGERRLERFTVVLAQKPAPKPPKDTLTWDDVRARAREIAARRGVL